MEIVRTDYFPQSSPLLPSWIPSGGLFVQLMRCVLDNHFQDVVQSIIHPYLLPNFVYAARLSAPPPNTFQVTLRIGANVSNLNVLLSRDVTDIYDRAEPFALFDGEWLLVFNLHSGLVTGGVSASGKPHPLWTSDDVPGTLVYLTNHLVGGRALWRVGSSAWRMAVLEDRGLFIPGNYSNVQCYYERRPPFPQVTMSDGTALDFRWMWSRADDVLRQFANPRRVRSAGSAFASLRGRLPGIHLFGVASECGLVSFLPNVPAYRQTVLPANVTAVYRTYDGHGRSSRYPNTISHVPEEESAHHTGLVVIHNAWLEGVVIPPGHTLSDEVS